MGHEIKNLYRASYLERPVSKSKERIIRELTRLFSIIRSVLVIRILFGVFNVLPKSFLETIDTISYPLVAPFYFLLQTSPSYGSLSEVEMVSIFAIAIYSLIGFVAIDSFKSSVASTPAEEYEQ